MACRILVVQHAEKKQEPGDPGLTEQGREQAAATARWLKVAITELSWKNGEWQILLPSAVHLHEQARHRPV
jgi:hypothetical protein